MKRGIIAAIILTAVTAFAVTVNITLTKKAEMLHSLAHSAVNDRAELETLCEEWEKQIIYFELFTDHGYFEPLDRKIKKLRYVDGKSYPLACAEAMLDIAAFKEHVSFSFRNIF